LPDTPTPRAPVGSSGLPDEPTFELVGDPFVRTLEEPNLRLKLTNAIAEAIGTVLMILLLQRGQQKWLSAIPLARWREILREEIRRARNPGEEREKLLRRLAADVARVEVSRDGRVTLPKSLAARCGITNEVTVWPRIDRLEITPGKGQPSKEERERIEGLYPEYQGGVTGLI